jgi:hypothetical protein
MQHDSLKWEVWRNAEDLIWAGGMPSRGMLINVSSRLRFWFGMGGLSSLVAVKHTTIAMPYM